MNNAVKSISICKKNDKLKQNYLCNQDILTQDLLQKIEDGRLFSNIAQLIKIFIINFKYIYHLNTDTNDDSVLSLILYIYKQYGYYYKWGLQFFS
jgi:hypothetical protein